MYARLENNIVQETIAMNAADFAYYYPPDFRALCVECAEEVEQQWTYDGGTFSPPPAPPEPTLEEIIAATVADYENRIQQRLDGFARTLTYESMLSACTYATSKIDIYRVEGQYCVDARDSTWAVAYGLIQDILPTVLSGGPVPAWEEIEAELPPLAWPEGSRGYAG